MFRSWRDSKDIMLPGPRTSESVEHTLLPCIHDTTHPQKTCYEHMKPSFPTSRKPAEIDIALMIEEQGQGQSGLCCFVSTSISGMHAIQPKTFGNGHLSPTSRIEQSLGLDRLASFAGGSASLAIGNSPYRFDKGDNFD